MATSAKALSLEKDDDWVLVQHRRNKHRQHFPKLTASQQPKVEPPQPWTPLLGTSPERELKLLQKMRNHMERLEKSEFFRHFIDQIQAPEVMAQFMKVLGLEPKMQMVIYGIGSIELFDCPRLQLSLAILMKKKFSWIGEIEVFDPVISLAESNVMEALDCYVLQVNEHGRRQASKPTLFYLPHCEVELYSNLLQANWKPDMMNRMVLLGNSFEAYATNLSSLQCKNLHIGESRKHMIAARKFAKEFRIYTISDDCYRAFHGSSWHFFCLESEADLLVENID